MKRVIAAAIAAAVPLMLAHGQGVPPYRLIIRPDSASQAPFDGRSWNLGAVVRRSSAIDDMKAALRDLVVAEERYFVGHDSYTADANALPASPEKHGQATTKVIFASSIGWSGIASEPTLQGKHCVMYVGSLKALAKGAPKTPLGIEA